MKPICILVGVLLACGGCFTSRPGGSASSSDFEKNTRVAELGPYRVQVGMDGTNDTLLITKGEAKVYSQTGSKVSVYTDGQSLFDYACGGPDNVLAAYMVHIRDAQGNVAFMLIDENADGVFDRKIDYGTKAIYVWKDNQWATWK
jgi:hypothetical protein